MNGVPWLHAIVHIISLVLPGCTPLYRAILNNDTDMVREVLHAGADVNLRRLGMADDSLGETPLMK